MAPSFTLASNTFLAALWLSLPYHTLLVTYIITVVICITVPMLAGANMLQVKTTFLYMQLQNITKFGLSFG
jgi:hypothetical protein